MSDERDREVAELMAAVSATGLHSEAPALFNLEDTIVGQVVQRAVGESLEGLLAAAVRNGTLNLSEYQLEIVTRHHRESMAHNLLIEASLIDAAKQLSMFGIEFRVLKGVALAHQAYRDSSERAFGDVDLLVRAEELDAAVEVLVNLGARRRLPPIRPGFDSRFAKDVTLLLGDVAIDLHRTLISGPLGERLDRERLFDSPDEIKFGGMTLLTLNGPDHYLHAALTAGAGDVPPRYVTLRDLLELELGQMRVDPAVARDRAQSQHLTAAFARGVNLAVATLRTDQEPLLARWAEGFRAPLTEQILMNAYTGRGRGYRRTLLTIGALPTWKDRITFARSILLPSTEYLAARGWTVDQHLLRAARRLRS